MDARKSIALVIIFILFIVSVGEYASNYNIAISQASLLALINITIISIEMMAIPFCFKLCNKKLIGKRGIIICLINSIILFLFSIIISTITNHQYYIGLISIIAYFFVNMCLFIEPKHKLELEKDIIIEEKSGKSENKEVNKKIEKLGEDCKKRYCTRCGNEVNNEWSFCRYCGNKIE